MTHAESQTDGSHVGELRLRRFRAGELSGPEHDEIARHTCECGPCRSKLRLLQEEQRQFERDLPFDRFAGGVERACRVPRVRPPRVWALSSAFALAAAAAVVVMIWPFGQQVEVGHRSHNQIKGGPSALIRIASAGGDAQRLLQPAETTALRPGERLRLGYATAAPGYLSAVSLDERGEISALYPEGGGSLPVAATAQTTYLPDSLELTGSGRERVFLFLADRPLDAEAVAQSVRQAQGKGDLTALPVPVFPGRNDVRGFTWLLQKP
jgi:hypothetical protein